MTRVLYPLSADPVTNGHIDVVKRASKIFDEVVVAAAFNKQKKYTFDHFSRIQFLKNSLEKISNCQVVGYEGLTVDYAWENGFDAIIRGVRDIDDFKNEQNLFILNESQHKGIEVIPFFSSRDKRHISSSAVKELVSSGGFVQDFVPLDVKYNLEKALNKQVLVGVTGEIAMGKTHFCESVMRLKELDSKKIHHLNLDALGHKLLQKSDKIGNQKLRESIIQEFGNEVLDEAGNISRKVLGGVVFSDKNKRKFLDNLLRQPLMIEIRKNIYGKQGLILLDGALLVEAGFLDLVNNKVILISSDTASQAQRMIDRGYTKEQINHRLESQFRNHNKKLKILNAIEQKNFGRLEEVNSSSDYSEKYLKELLRNFE